MTILRMKNQPFNMKHMHGTTTGTYTKKSVYIISNGYNCSVKTKCLVFAERGYTVVNYPESSILSKVQRNRYCSTMYADCIYLHKSWKMDSSSIELAMLAAKCGKPFLSKNLI